MLYKSREKLNGLESKKKEIVSILMFCFSNGTNYLNSTKYYNVILVI